MCFNFLLRHIECVYLFHMCGIVGYIGKREATPVLLAGLRRLEYRGYDSAGIAVVDERASDKEQTTNLVRIRAVGKVEELEKKVKNLDLSGTLGIAHTRWATHGGVTEANAHPHFALDNKLVICHNGIIENYRELKEGLKKTGVEFVSETDTEVLAHLIGSMYENTKCTKIRNL